MSYAIDLCNLHALV